MKLSQNSGRRKNRVFFFSWSLHGKQVHCGVHTFLICSTCVLDVQKLFCTSWTHCPHLHVPFVCFWSWINFIPITWFKSRSRHKNTPPLSAYMPFPSSSIKKRKKKKIPGASTIVCTIFIHVSLLTNHSWCGRALWMLRFQTAAFPSAAPSEVSRMHPAGRINQLEYYNSSSTTVKRTRKNIKVWLLLPKLEKQCILGESGLQGKASLFV